MNQPQTVTHNHVLAHHNLKSDPDNEAAHHHTSAHPLTALAEPKTPSADTAGKYPKNHYEAERDEAEIETKCISIPPNSNETGVGPSKAER